MTVAAPAGLRIGMVVFDAEEGRRRLEMLNDWKRGVRDPLGLEGLRDFFAFRLFPPLKSNMKVQADRWFWAPAIVDWSCRRTLDALPLAAAQRELHARLEYDEKHAWGELGHDYRYTPRRPGWFNSLPHRAYLPTLKRMGLLAHSTPQNLLLAHAAPETAVPTMPAGAAPAPPSVHPLAYGFARALARRRDWLSASLRRRGAKPPQCSGAEVQLLAKLFSSYGCSTQQPSLIAWCLRERVSVVDALARWKGSAHLRRRQPDLARLVREAGHFCVARDITERWFLRCVGKGKLRERVAEGPAGFARERAQLHRATGQLRSYFDNWKGDGSPAEATTSASAEISLGRLEAIAAASGAWSAEHRHLVELVRGLKPGSRRFSLSGEEADSAASSRSDHALNSWLASEHWRQLAGGR